MLVFASASRAQVTLRQLCPVCEAPFSASKSATLACACPR